MSFPQYPEYKDSGVEWLGEVPAHWVVSPFKWQIDANDGGAWGEDPLGDNDTYVLRSIDQTVDGRWKVTDPALRHLSQKEQASTVLKAGDLVVTKSSGSSLHIGKTTLVDKCMASKGFSFGNFMQRIRTKRSFLPKLAWYFMNNAVARLQLDLLSNSTTGLANLNGTIIGEVQVATPPQKEQTDIVAFLDHETARIDALVEEQQRLIGLLKEKRQAVISHAVTKGLDPDVPMKDSGVEWLGEVPAHWDVVPLKFIVSTSVTDGPHETPEFIDDGVPFVSAEAVSSGKIDFDKARFIRREDHERFSRKYSPKKHDIYMVKSGATTGITAIVEGDMEFNIWSPLAVIRCKDWVDPYFVLHSMRSTNFQESVVLNWSYGTQQNIGMGVIENLPIAIPPENEQKEISAFLSSHVENWEVLTQEASRTVSLLQERRSALISAAVTGKIDVRGWQPPAGSPVSEATQTVMV